MGSRDPKLTSERSGSGLFSTAYDSASYGLLVEACCGLLRFGARAHYKIIYVLLDPEDFF